jgi:anaphase-promoting complex subunit 7
MNSFQKLQNMFDEELYSNAHILAQFYQTNPAFFHLSQEELFAIYVLNASCLWEMKNYTEAQKLYERSILMRRQFPKEHKISQNLVATFEKFTEIELKFKVAKCMVENQLFKEACALLQPIPLKQRSAKINMLLVKIQHGESGTDKQIIMNSKEVLRRCPLAFECIDGLISLGVKGTEVNSLIINGKL